MIFYYILIFIFGLVFGSFFNVLIYRIPEKKSIVFPSSFCPVCKTSIKWYDNIPLISYIILRGKCRYCKAKISIIYPLVEFFTGLIFLLIFIKVGFNLLSIIYIILFSTLLVSSFIDLKTKNVYIPVFFIPVIIYLLYVSIFLLSVTGESEVFKLPFLDFKESILGGFVGGLFIFVVRFLASKVMKKEGMGEGDIYVSSFIGLFIGYPLIFYVFIIAGILGLLAYFFYYRKKPEPEIPFVPFLSLSSFIVFFLFDILKKLY